MVFDRSSGELESLCKFLALPVNTPISASHASNVNTFRDVNFEKLDKELGLPSGSTGRLIEGVARQLNYKVVGHKTADAIA
jgi:hypothetical protein